MPDRDRPSGWSQPVALLPKALLEPLNVPRSVVLGWLTAIVPSILLSFLVAKLLPTLGQPELALDTGTALFLVAVAAPVIETLIMAGVLAVLLRFLPPTAAVLASAAGWGIAHSLAAPAWGLVIWWPFLIFSTLYVTWRRRSLLAALAVPASVHMMQNTAPVLLLASGVTG